MTTTNNQQHNNTTTQQHKGRTVPKSPWKVPPGQVRHRLWDVRSLNVPCGHSSHAVWPFTPWNLPTGQAVHVSLPGSAWYVPASHNSHVAWLLCRSPGGHDTHAVRLANVMVLPVQSVHTDSPVMSATRPVGQAVQQGNDMVRRQPAEACAYGTHRSTQWCPSWKRKTRAGTRHTPPGLR